MLIDFLIEAVKAFASMLAVMIVISFFWPLVEGIFKKKP